MWHTIENVAQGRLLDAERFKRFVHENYAHCLDRFNMLQTLDIDDIVTAYRASMSPEEAEAERQRIIQQRMKECHPN